ncbi:MAG: UDP-3-O-(3-hydroxymyristoyl)glucosamine N-acyltransferase [Akkermansia sp.]
MTLTLESLLALTGGIILVNSPDIVITGVASLHEACSTEASFLGNAKYYDDFLKTQAGLVLVPPGLPKHPEGVVLIEVENPSLAFNALVKFFKASSYSFKPGIHPSAVVDPTATLNPDLVCVGPHAVIGAGVKIGDGTDIGAGCCIGDGAIIGIQCRLHANVVIRERCRLGDRVVIQPGAVIGSDGFGFLMNDEGRYVGIDQVGIVDLGDDVDIGANTTIDRARFGRTIIKEGTKIDNLVQIGHNVVVGKNCIIVSQTGVAGSTIIGDNCVFAAQVGVAGHLKIGDKTTLAVRTGVMNDLPGNAIYWGLIASPFKDGSRQYSAIRKLPEFLKEFNALKKTLSNGD